VALLGHQDSEESFETGHEEETFENIYVWRSLAICSSGAPEGGRKRERGRERERERGKGGQSDKQRGSEKKKKKERERKRERASNASFENISLTDIFKSLLAAQFTVEIDYRADF